MTHEEFALFSLELPGTPEEATAQPHRFISIPKLAAALELANLAAKTGIDMNQIVNDDPVYETKEHTPVSLSIHSSVQASLKEANQILIQHAVNDLLYGSSADLNTKYGPDVVAKAKELATTRKPTRRQVMTRYRREERQRSRQFWKDLLAAGVEICQHSVQDYVRVIQTQLDLQAKGENPSAQKVAESSFSNDKKKANSISNSTRRARWKQAYESDAIKNHPVQIALRKTHGEKSMQLRLSAKTFRNSLGVNATLYQSCETITRLQQQVDSLTARVEHLERQMRSTKLRETLADAGFTYSKEKVLALKAEGLGQTEIASALGMSVNTVKSILHRSKQS